MVSSTSIHSSDEGQLTTSNENAKVYSRVQIEAATKAEQQEHGPFVVREGVERNFSLFSIIGLAYACLNSWTAMASSISLAISSGGASVVVFGVIVAFVGNLAMALSMAEICAVYAVAGGQYHWAAVLAPAEWAPVLSYFNGWASVAGWWALTATASSLAGSLIIGAYSLAHPEFESKPYQTFLIYLGYALIALFMNIFTPRVLPHFDQAAIIWSLVGATVILIVCLATASPNFEPASFVFGNFINTTGWSDGVAWILGLLQASFGLIAYDACTHMVEEMPRPHVNAPRTMVLAVLLGSVSGFIFLFTLLFTINDVDTVISSTAGPLIASMYQATNSTAGTICLAVFPIGSMFFTAQALLTASSRMTFAFARDHGLPFSKFLSYSNPRTGVPDRSVILTSVLVIIFGLIYLGSSTAFNAIITTSVVLLSVSYCVPVIILLVRGRHLLRPASFPKPAYTLGRFGPAINIFACAYMLTLTVFFLFPPELPVTASDMNYSIAVVALVALVATVHWFVKANKTFSGPRDLGALVELARAEMELDPNLDHSNVQERDIAADIPAVAGKERVASSTANGGEKEVSSAAQDAGMNGRAEIGK